MMMMTIVNIYDYIIIIIVIIIFIILMLFLVIIIIISIIIIAIYSCSQSRHIVPQANESNHDFQLRMEEIWISTQGPGNILN
jgi:lipopolysaccharide export LptBFGC system permease protein LptF